jgi:hypothetical protein
MDLRTETTQALRVYMMRSGFPLSLIADQAGFAPQTLKQFVSAARFGSPATKGEDTARRLSEWMTANPVALPELPGHFYETEATREIDFLLDEVAEGAWGKLYGPSGSQKTFVLEYRAAEAARQAEPRIIYINCSAAGMSPNVLLRRIASALGVPYAQTTEGLRQQIFFAVRRRRTSVALVIDEADHFHWRLDTLETLREIGDALPARGNRAGVGILIVGNEGVMDIFRDRPGMYMEKWKGRISQVERRVIGPSIEKAKGIILSELGQLKTANVNTILYGKDGRTSNVVQDPVSGEDYVTAHGLFHAIRRIQKLRKRSSQSSVVSLQ